MIVHINHISQSKKGAKKSQLGELASLVTGSLVDLVENGQLDAKVAPSLRIHLDWIQYKTNFRDPVIVRRTTDAQGKSLSLAEVAIDLRQCQPATLLQQLQEAAQQVNPSASRDTGRDNAPFYLADYKPFRDCVIWDFNRVFWRHLGDWEAASGKGFEEALPSHLEHFRQRYSFHTNMAWCSRWSARRGRWWCASSTEISPLLSSAAAAANEGPGACH